MKRKLELNQCTKCKRTYDLKVVNATIDTCASCNDCKNKIDGTYQEVCSNCKRFYGCYFEAKEV